MVAKPRAGFSLIEMLVATAILLVAVGVLTELADVGRRHARGAEDAAAAQRICQNLLEGILCGALPLEATPETLVPEEPEWTYLVEVKPLERFKWEPGLAELRVTVTKTAVGSKPGKPFSLSRWIRYPSGEKTPREGINRPAASPNRRPVSGGPRP
jgi:prepilin-type N-terminal cleavage/methylation domain-containing protein